MASANPGGGPAAISHLPDLAWAAPFAGQRRRSARSARPVRPVRLPLLPPPPTVDGLVIQSSQSGVEHSVRWCSSSNPRRRVVPRVPVAHGLNPSSAPNRAARGTRAGRSPSRCPPSCGSTLAFRLRIGASAGPIRTRHSAASDQVGSVVARCGPAVTSRPIDEPSLVWRFAWRLPDRGHRIRRRSGSAVASTAGAAPSAPGPPFRWSSATSRRTRRVCRTSPSNAVRSLVCSAPTGRARPQSCACFSA